MKNLIFIILLFAFYLTAGKVFPQGWAFQSSPTTQYLYSVHFPSASTGYIAGQAGTILKTTNAGIVWTQLTSGATGFLYTVWFITPTTGWVTGQNGVIRKTTNGGQSWFAQTSGFPTNYLYSVQFTDENTGIVTGSGGLILRTTNGGSNWNPVPSPVTNTISNVFFPVSGTSLTGYASGGTATEGIVLKTVDGGNNWTILPGTGSNWLFGLYFINPSTGWAVGYNGSALKTTNGGSNWTTLNSGTTNRLLYVDFPDENTGYAAGYTGTIIKTTNGGMNWFTQYCPSMNNLWGLDFINTSTGWAVGWFGALVATTNGGGVTGINGVITSVPDKYYLIQNYPNPFNPSTIIEFGIPEESYVILTIYDLSGREMEQLINKKITAGKHHLIYDSPGLSGGVYFYKLTADNGRRIYSETRKMIIIR